MYTISLLDKLTNLYRQQQGNMFRTTEEAEYHRKMQDLAAGIRAQGRGFKYGGSNYIATYGSLANNIQFSYHQYNNYSRISFPTREAAQAAFKGVSGEDFLYMLNGGMI